MVSNTGHRSRVPIGTCVAFDGDDSINVQNDGQGLSH